MNAGASYARGVEIGAVMGGGTVSQVVASNLKSYAPGDFVLTANAGRSTAYRMAPVCAGLTRARRRFQPAGAVGSIVG